MVDAVRLQKTAARLIAANGRSVTFLRHDATPADANKPWNGPTDARSAAAETSDQSAVMVEPSGAVRLGLSSAESDLVKRSEKIFIVSASVDLLPFHEVLDEEVYWKITRIETLRPGSTTLLSLVGVKR